MGKPESQRASIQVPRFISVAIEQIVVQPSTFRWTDEANFYPMSIPSMREHSLRLLQLLQPVLVRRADDEVVGESKKAKPLYTLIGGRRTLQLVAEQKSRDAKISVVLLGDDSVDRKDLEVMDLLCSTLVRRPDHSTMALLAYGLLEDVEFSQVASTLLGFVKVEDVAAMLGVSKAKVYRMVSDDLRMRLGARSGVSSQSGDTGLGDALDANS